MSGRPRRYRSISRAFLACASIVSLSMGTVVVATVVGSAPASAALTGHDDTVYAFGSAPFRGSTSGKALTKPVVAIAATPSGNGYWLVAKDGGVFSFGDAQFRGSTGGMHLVAPVGGIARDGTPHGYWLAAEDGGVFSFGSAHFQGSAAGLVKS